MERNNIHIDLRNLKKFIEYHLPQFSLVLIHK